MLPLSLETGEAVFWILEKTDPDDSEGEKNDFPFIPQKKREQILKLEWQVSRRGRLQKEFEPIGTISGESYPNMNGPEGDPGFTGTYRYEGTFSFAKESEQQSRFLLKIPGAGDTARLFLNGKDLGYMAGFPNHVEVTDINALPLVDEKRLVTTGGHFAYLKIAEGCDKHCTYCIIPKLRGNYRSVPMERLIKEAEDLAEQGVKELILVAQETTVYGQDIYGESWYRWCNPHKDGR